MRKRYVIFLFFLAVSLLTFDVSHVYAQFTTRLDGQPTQEWVARYIRNPGGWQAQGPFFALDKSGNSYVAGPNLINDTENICLVKFDNSGNQVWSISFRNVGYLDNEIAALSIDTSGNPYIAGTYGTDPMSMQYIQTIRFDKSNGNAIWVKTFYGYLVSSEDLNMVMDRQNNFYLVSNLRGNSTDSSLCIKCNSNGDTLWARTWRPQGSYREPWIFNNCVTIDDSLNVIITGHGGACSQGFCYDSTAVWKYSPDGVLMWDRAFAYYASYSAVNQGQIVTTDQFGNIYVAGQTSSSSSNRSYLTMKYDYNGNLIWASRWYQLYDNFPKALTEDKIHNFVYVTGYNQAPNNLEFAATIKYNSLTGDSVWVRRDTGTYATGGSYDISGDSSGNAYIAGYTYGTVSGSDVLTIKYSSQGIPLWSITYNGPYNGVEIGYVLHKDNLNNIYVCGVSQSGSQQFDFIVIKYSQISGLHQISSNIPKVFNLGQNYPNPFNPSTKIRFGIAKPSFVQVKIFDILGQLKEVLVSKDMQPSEYEISFDGSNYASGIYFYQLIAGSKIIGTKKFVIAK